MQPDCKDNK